MFIPITQNLSFKLSCQCEGLIDIIYLFVLGMPDLAIKIWLHGEEKNKFFSFFFLQLFRWGQFVHENELNLNFQFWNNNEHDWVMQCRFDCILYHTKLS